MNAIEIEQWLVARLSQQLKLPPEKFDAERNLEEYGFDSLEAIALTSEIEKLLGQTISPTILWDYPTVRSVSRYLASEYRNLIDRKK